MPAATLAKYGLAGKLVNAAALGALAASLMQLGRVRRRRIGAVAFVAFGVAALGVIVSMPTGFPSEACFHATSVVSISSTCSRSSLRC